MNEVATERDDVWFRIGVVALALLHVAINIRGLSWGLPSSWHPDEVVTAVQSAIALDYVPLTPPGHPNFYLLFLYACGKVTSLFAGQASVAWSLRAASLAVGALGVAGVIVMARQARVSRAWALGAGALTMTTTCFAGVSHFAHNDIFIVTLAVASITLALRYLQDLRPTTLYGAFALCGAAAGCKYNGVLILPILVALPFVIAAARQVRWRLLRFGLSSFLAVFLLAIAPGLANAPWFIAYNVSNYWTGYLSQKEGWGAGVRIGLFGHWAVIVESIGLPQAILGAVAILLVAWKLISDLRSEGRPALRSHAPAIVLFACVAAYDLPLNVSRMYPMRFITPIVPFLSVLMVIVLEQTWNRFASARRGAIARCSIAAVFAVTLLFSLARVISLGLLFENDSRVSTERYLASLPASSSIEYLAFGWDLELRPGMRRYPLFQQILASDAVPAGFNVGCEGLESRAPEYFVWDSFTHGNFGCAPPRQPGLHQRECACWNAMLQGESAYVPLRRFLYRVPPPLPDVEFDFVNPEVIVFRRTR